MTKEEIANEILSQFARRNSKPNHVIDERWIYHFLLPKLNPKEKNLLDPAIKQLESKGLVTTEDRNGFCIVLTEKGFDSIYPIDEEKTIDNIGRKILNRFAETNSKVNDTVDNKWINFNLRKELNPKEEALIDDAINKLVNEELITTDDRYGFCMVLTKKGFDTIY